jgi:hypothetical protein
MLKDRGLVTLIASLLFTSSGHEQTTDTKWIKQRTNPVTKAVRYVLRSFTAWNLTTHNLQLPRDPSRQQNIQV